MRVLAAAELSAFVADLDAVDMVGHNNVFLRNGIEADIAEYEGDEEEEEEHDDDKTIGVTMNLMMFRSPRCLVVDSYCTN